MKKLTQKQKNIITFSILVVLLITSITIYINRKSIISFANNMLKAQQESDKADSLYSGNKELLVIDGIRLSDATLVAKDGNIYSNNGERVLLCQVFDEYVLFPDNSKVYFDGTVEFIDGSTSITSKVYLEGSFLKVVGEEDKQEEILVDKNENNQTVYNEGNSSSSNIKNHDELVDKANTERKEGEKDQYLTDPTPEGMPSPVEPEAVVIDTNSTKVCTLSIGCSTILNNMDKFNSDKSDCLPSNGVILSTTQVTFYDGESVYDVLTRETSKRGIHMESSFTPMYNSAYVEGINNLYEFDCGELSGWMYKVNGWYPNYGCSRYLLKQGDVICWEYTCDLGVDLGCKWIGESYD